MKKISAAAMGIMVFLLLFVGQSDASFKDCYAKCFIFCMIEPSQTLCSCSTHCLKDCIFSDTPPNGLQEDDNGYQEAPNLGFCKLGCAFSTCSNISSKAKPNVDKMDGCVGSCSTACAKSYSSP